MTTNAIADKPKRRRRSGSGDAGVGLDAITKVIQAALSPVVDRLDKLEQKQAQPVAPANVLPKYEQPEDRLERFQQARAAGIRGLSGAGQATEGTMTASNREQYGAAPLYHPGDAARNVEADIVVFTPESEKGQALQRARAQEVRRRFAETVFEKPMGKLTLEERKALDTNADMQVAIKEEQAKPFPLAVVTSVLYRGRNGEWKYKLQFPDLGKNVRDAARESELQRAV